MTDPRTPHPLAVPPAPDAPQAAPARQRRCGTPRIKPAGRALLLALPLALTACQPVDRWGVFDVDWQAQLEREARQRKPDLTVPDRLKPAPTTAVEPVEIPKGDSPIELSIEQAVVAALSKNRDLAVQQLEPVIVGAFEQIERGVYDPELFAGADYSERQASEESRATGETFGVQAANRVFEAGVRQRLPTGTTLELSATEGRSHSNRTAVQHDARLGLTATQALLEGFGPAVNLVRIQQAELDTRASEYELRGFTEALLAEVEITYWNYTFAREAIDIFEQSLELARLQEAETEQRIEVGVLSPTEAAAARAEVALRNQALIDARSELEVQRLRLLRLVNAAPSVGALELNRRIVPITPPEAPTFLIEDLQERVNLAHRFRPDLNEARLRLEQARLETIWTRNGLLPRLDLFMTLGKSGFGSTFRDASRNFEEDSYDFSAGVRFSHFLGNRADEARDLAARANRQQAAAAIDNLRQLVTLDVQIAAAEVERSRQQIAATAATHQLREEALRAEQERFRVGSSTSLLVAQAQRDLVASQIDEIEAVVGYRIALINLHLAEGTLLERRGIVIHPTTPWRDTESTLD